MPRPAWIIMMLAAYGVLLASVPALAFYARSPHCRHPDAYRAQAVNNAILCVAIAFIVVGMTTLSG